MKKPQYCKNCEGNGKICAECGKPFNIERGACDFCSSKNNKKCPKCNI